MSEGSITRHDFQAGMLTSRKAHDIEKGYKKRGISSKEAERRAWATVNKSDRGGRKKRRGGRGKKRSKSSTRKGGRKVVKGNADQRTRRSNAGRCPRISL